MFVCGIFTWKWTKSWGNKKYIYSNGIYALTCCWWRCTKRFMEIDIWLLLTFFPLPWSLWNVSLDVARLCCCCSSRDVADTVDDPVILSSICMPSVFDRALFKPPLVRIQTLGSFSLIQSSPRTNKLNVAPLTDRWLLFLMVNSRISPRCLAFDTIFKTWKPETGTRRRKKQISNYASASSIVFIKSTWQINFIIRQLVNA